MITNTFISLYYPFLLSVSFSLVLPAMINLFKKNIHSLFTFTTTTAATIGSGIHIQSTENVDNTPDVPESAKLKQDPPAGGRDWIDDTGGRVSTSVSCTESLGFESSDEIHNKNVGGVGDGDGNNEYDGDEIWRRRRMMRAEGRGNRRKLRSFPPPLSSLNRSGKPSFFLRPVRKDGRLELTEVRIHRAEILHASRHDGRLTLHLISDQVSLEEEEEEEEEVEEEEEEEEEEIVEEKEIEEEEIALDKEEEEEEEEIESEREERVAEWGFHEGLRRCHEMVNQHHHHHHHNVHGNHHHNHHLRMCGISIV